MIFRYINPKSAEWLIPPWIANPYHIASALEKMLASHHSAGYRWKVDQTLDFWAEIVSDGLKWSSRLCASEGEETEGHKGSVIIERDKLQVIVPLNNLLKGMLNPRDTHSLYAHSFDVPVPLTYIGITKRRWWDRLSQHQSSARSGSPFLFHHALRQHSGVRMLHRVLLAGLPHDSIMELEERFVARMSLYPLGLNMIPGGFAGMRYLHKLGIGVRDSGERDAAIEHLVTQTTIGSRPNPLCAARWESDQDFVNRVICGHSGRLTVEEVQSIRMMATFGRPAREIAEAIQRPIRRVSNVIDDKTYARVT